MWADSLGGRDVGEGLHEGVTRGPGGLERRPRRLQRRPPHRGRLPQAGPVPAPRAEQPGHLPRGATVTDGQQRRPRILNRRRLLRVDDQRPRALHLLRARRGREVPVPGAAHRLVVRGLGPHRPEFSVGAPVAPFGAFAPPVRLGLVQTRRDPGAARGGRGHGHVGEAADAGDVGGAGAVDADERGGDGGGGAAGDEVGDLHGEPVARLAALLRLLRAGQLGRLLAAAGGELAEGLHGTRLGALPEPRGHLLELGAAVGRSLLGRLDARFGVWREGRLGVLVNALALLASVGTGGGLVVVNPLVRDGPGILGVALDVLARGAVGRGASVVRARERRALDDLLPVLAPAVSILAGSHGGRSVGRVCGGVGGESVERWCGRRLGCFERASGEVCARTFDRARG
mmetsp:Transcript_9039/g.25200  ORF Transcript_9039/g.25200 Transcript_9039/m.25200 type:complete len:401 (+) Transcript_9039:157-1359(+)